MFSPAGQALLHGGRRSRYTGRAVRQDPVRLASEVPGLRVIAKGLLAMSVTLLQQAILANVAVGDGLHPGDHFRMRVLAEQMREAPLWLQVFFHRNLAPYLQYPGDFAMLSLEHREHAALLGQPGDAYRVMRGSA